MKIYKLCVALVLLTFVVGCNVKVPKQAEVEKEPANVLASSTPDSMQINTKRSVFKAIKIPDTLTLIKPTEVTKTDFLKDKGMGITEDTTIESVDYNADRKFDFLILTTIPDATDMVTEYWFTNKYELVYTVEEPFWNINYKWFCDIDFDGIPELFRAQGFEDGINYSVAALKAGGIQKLFYFNPVTTLKSNGKTKNYWVHPWYFSKIQVKATAIEVSLKEIVRDDSFKLMPNQKIMPSLVLIPSTNFNYEYEETVLPMEYMPLSKLLTVIAK